MDEHVGPDTGNARDDQRCRKTCESFSIWHGLARLNGDGATAADLKEYLVANLDRLVEGLHYVETLGWLRNLQLFEPERALQVYQRIQPQLFDDPPEVGPWNHGVAVSLALLKRQTGDQAAAERLAREVLEVVKQQRSCTGTLRLPSWRSWHSAMKIGPCRH